MAPVLNWLWQGGVVVLVTAAILRMIDVSRAQARYATLWVALLSVLVLPLVPLLLGIAMTAPPGEDMIARAGPVVWVPFGWWSSEVVVLALWAVWSSVYASRVGRALLALRRAKSQCQPFPPEVEAQLPCWSRVRTTGRRTRLALSTTVRSAAVLGRGSTVIAIAPTLLEHVSHEELDRIVIHEWAHIQRRDDLANILQALVRVLAGWHPAVWWLDRQLCVERESACDEIAVAVTGSPKDYAACLVKLASLPAVPLQPLPELSALASWGVRQRIIRILSRDHLMSARSRWATVTGAAVGLGVVALIIGGLRLVQTRVTTVTAAATAPSAASVGNPVALLMAPRRLSSEPGLAPQASATTVRQTTPPRRPARTGVAATGAGSMPDAFASSPPKPADTLPATPATPSARGKPPVSTVPAKSVLDSFALHSTAAPVLASGARISAPAIVAVTDVKPTSPWGAAADAGVAVGRGSQKAALATAGFFSRVAKTIAGSFQGDTRARPSRQPQ
jgi:beta-lactamase regulating signal transducer with metallopeptidase domain